VAEKKMREKNILLPIFVSPIFLSVLLSAKEAFA
jgi:ABC-type transport system involved in cytochrome c biogenesis permease component